MNDGQLCTCEVEDDGDGESGPHLSLVELDEACPVHGRAADPDGWAESEAVERGYTLSLLNLPGGFKDVEVALALVKAAWEKLDREAKREEHAYEEVVAEVSRQLRKRGAEEEDVGFIADPYGFAVVQIRTIIGFALAKDGMSEGERSNLIAFEEFLRERDN
jgi:hypothetical protein